MTEDLLDRLRSYRPTNESMAAEWNATTHAASRRIATADSAGRAIRFQARRPGRLRLAAPIAASVAVLAVAATGALVIRGGGGSDDALAGGHPVHLSSASLSSTSDVGPRQYSYRVDHAYNQGADGQPLADQEWNRNYVASNGDVVSIRSGQQDECYVFTHSGGGDFEQPTAQFFATLPIDPAALRTYLLGHVSGSSSKDEAVFVAVGDMLRQADGLASPRLRAALVDVLSTSHLISVHEGQHDALNRVAVRVDFMDQERRPGELQSLYFDPFTFQLLEERQGTNGQAGPQPGPSFPYGATPTSTPKTPAQLTTGPANIDVMTSERVVDQLPSLPATCVRDGG